jgi:hypothetical protein
MAKAWNFGNNGYDVLLLVLLTLYFLLLRHFFPHLILPFITFILLYASRCPAYHCFNVHNL